MKTLIILIVVAATSASWRPAQARTIVECIDQAGNVTFASQTCPAGTTKRADKRVAGFDPGTPNPAAEMAKVAKKHPVVMFSIKPCDSCDLMRLLLQKRGIPFTEKDAGADLAVQAELRKATGGQLSVPTITVDGQVITGYNKPGLESALDSAGYPPPTTTAASENQGTPGKNASESGSEAASAPDAKAGDSETTSP
jgi:glutaredoxin